jgi:hypothetical protein
MLVFELVEVDNGFDPKILREGGSKVSKFPTFSKDLEWRVVQKHFRLHMIRPIIL